MPLVASEKTVIIYCECPRGRDIQNSLNERQCLFCLIAYEIGDYSIPYPIVLLRLMCVGEQSIQFFGACSGSGDGES